MTIDAAAPAAVTPTDALAAQLRELIEPDRAEFVGWFAERIKRGIERFLDRRNGVLMIHEVYRNEPEPVGIKEATDYRESEKSFLKADAYGVRTRPEARQPWPVSFRPDADAAILKVAEEQADQQIRTFLSRALDKLGPVAEAVSEYTATRKGRTLLNGSVWVGELDFHFIGMRFTARLKVITNWSVNGNPYAQYPMTFHDFVHDPGYGADVRAAASASIEDIWAAVGHVPPPAPPAMARRWKKLVTGAVVLVDGRPTLIESPSAAKKAGIPEDAEQVARIVNVDVCTNPFKGEPRVTGAVEYAADGRRVRYELSDGQADGALGFYRAGRYNAATAMARRLIFNKAFGR